MSAQRGTTESAMDPPPAPSDHNLPPRPLEESDGAPTEESGGDELDSPAPEAEVNELFEMEESGLYRVSSCGHPYWCVPT